MAILDLNQAREYITALTGNVDTVMTWQVFYDPKDGTERPDLATHFQAKVNEVTPVLQRAEANLCGVYVCINPTNGGRFKADVTGVRALFADFDGIEEPNYPIPPHLVTRRDATHGHAYWLVEDVAVEDFMFLQRRIATALNTDVSVIDPSRVARVCGTAHLKKPLEPQMYSVCENRQLPKYTSTNILNAFELNDVQQTAYDKWVASRESKQQGTGFEDDEFEVNRFINFLVNKAEPAQESIGSGGTGTVIKVCSMAHDLGIKLETAQAVAWEHYNPRCLPPWGEHEREHFDKAIGRAYLYARNVPGCRTTLNAFAGVEVKPLAVKDGVEVTRLGDRLTAFKAKLITAVMNAKSSHYELAQVFDGVLYDGKNVIRSNKIFYDFNGKSWSVVSDDYTKSLVQKFYARLKPSDSFVRGVYNSFCDLVTVGEVTNGTYLTSGKEAGDIISFKNGLVDLTKEKPVIMPHTSDYFCFNELGYDYEPNATCPKWLEFLTSIWDDDQELKEQLQEWFGYCLVNTTDMQKFALFIGVPRGGKGVIADMLEHLVGKDNAVAPSLSKLCSDSSLHRMSTAKLALIPDAHSVATSKRDEVLSNLKAITGGDSLDYHVMYKGSQTSKFSARIVLTTNNMPEFLDATGALAMRMLIFHFIRSFAGKEDVNLKDKLKTEIAGIAQWGLAGLKRVRVNGKFTKAASTNEMYDQVREDMNPLTEFIEDRLTFSTNAFISTRALYNTYLLWCDETGVRSPMAKNKVSGLIHSSAYPCERTSNGADRGFRGCMVGIPEPIGKVKEQ